MKIARVGKAGSGKTTSAGTLARLLGEQVGKVLVIDCDANSNFALGRRLELVIAEAEPQERYVAQAPDGVGRRVQKVGAGSCQSCVPAESQWSVGG